MKICLSCYHAQNGNGSYCGGCGRTYGVKLCEAKHANPPSLQVRCCSQCGSTQLTEPTGFLNLTWLPVLLAGLVALCVWRWMISHLPLLGSLLERLTVGGLAVLLDVPSSGIICGFHRLVAWFVSLWILGWMLFLMPGRGGVMGAWLRGLPGLVLKLGGHAALTMLGRLGHALRRAIGPAQHAKSRETKT